MRLTSKGQLTIPQAMRERYGLAPHTEVSFEPRADGLLIRPARAEQAARVARAIAKTRGSARKGLSTAEIMRLTRGED